MASKLSSDEHNALIQILQTRFEKNKHRHSDVDWSKVKLRLEAHPEKMWSLNEMEKTGGEPDFVAIDTTTNEFVFFDCAAESPKDRRSLCYDREALDARKEFKPENNVIDMAKAMGIELMDEQQYRELQQLGQFDTKTSSWIKTPESIRKLGGAIFGDFRYNTTFIYHNGAQSYYAARGFRGVLKV